MGKIFFSFIFLMGTTFYKLVLKMANSSNVGNWLPQDYKIYLNMAKF
jgi:hypothetical protein